MNKIVIINLVTMLCIVFFSCKKYLNEKSDKRLVELRMVNDLQALLDNKEFMNYRTPGFGESSTDDYFLLPDSYNSIDEMDQQVYTWRLDNYRYDNDWAFSYYAIHSTNYCLEQIENNVITGLNSEAWKNVKGSALFYRAFHFLNLTWEFTKGYDESSAENDLGIVLRLSSDFNIPSVRASVKETYNRIIEDAREASFYLPDNPQHIMRPSKAAAYGLLARVFLSMHKYDSAFKYANNALQIKNAILDFNSSEIDPALDIPIPPLNNEIVFYSTQSNYYTPKYSYMALIDTALYASYEDNDLRKSTYFFDNSGYKSFKGGYAGNPYLFFSGIAGNELLLIRSESSARIGNFAEAMNDLNSLLLKRWKAGTFTPFVALNKDEALNIIIKERRKELLMRGLRWSDIKRLNKEGANISLKRVISSETYTLPPNDKRFALPLPQDIIELTGVPQN